MNKLLTKVLTYTIEELYCEKQKMSDWQYKVVFQPRLNTLAFPRKYKLTEPDNI
jgi:hypothetical protein